MQLRCGNLLCAAAIMSGVRISAALTVLLLILAAQVDPGELVKQLAPAVVRIQCKGIFGQTFSDTRYCSAILNAIASKFTVKLVTTEVGGQSTLAYYDMVYIGECHAS